jgi:hypothetical protein
VTENMKHWDALKATDPKYTKKVEFGRKFTSINSQWQLQRMTEQFGPIGQGWGYSVDHGIERITDDYVLAVADVRIWWGDDRGYGPVRGMSPILEKGRYDDDAGKKAMTDALTKGLSHLGLSADVFLGLFDDNKYVQNIAQQFKAGNGLPPKLAAEARLLNAEEGRDHLPEANMSPLPEEDRHLLKNGETRSTYRVAADAKPPGRAAAEFWASNVVLLFKQEGYDLLQYREWRGTPCTNKGTKTNDEKLAELREKHPDLAQQIDDAVSTLKVAVVA